MTAAGRLLRTLRSARGLSFEEMSARADIGPARLRRLERGTAVLEYLEGIRLAKGLDLCPNCFRRLFEAATEREVLAREELRPAVVEPANGAAPRQRSLGLEPVGDTRE